MSYYTIRFDTLTAIANAIRSKTGKTDAIPVTRIAADIESITSDRVELVSYPPGRISITSASVMLGTDNSISIGG